MPIYHSLINKGKFLLSLLISLFYLICYLYSKNLNFDNLFMFLPKYLYITTSIVLAVISIYDIYKMQILQIVVEAEILTIFIYLFHKNILEYKYILSMHLIPSIAIFFGMYAFSCFTKIATQRTLLGYGDAKVASMGAALLGLEGVFAVICIAFVTSGFFSLIGRISGLLKPWQEFPFAPFICLAIGIVWNFGKYAKPVHFFVL